MVCGNWELSGRLQILQTYEFTCRQPRSMPWLFSTFRFSSRFICLSGAPRLEAIKCDSICLWIGYYFQCTVAILSVLGSEPAIATNSSGVLITAWDTGATIIARLGH